jgi:hypothetical protein
MQDRDRDTVVAPCAPPGRKQGLRRWIIRAIVALLWVVASAGSVRAFEPLGPAQPPEEREEKDAPRYEFDLNGRSWKEVLLWLHQKTGLAIVGVIIPSDPFVADISPGKKYSIAEIINLINKAPEVAGQGPKFYLIRGEDSILIYFDEREVRRRGR